MTKFNKAKTMMKEIRPTKINAKIDCQLKTLLIYIYLNNIT